MSHTHSNLMLALSTWTKLPNVKEEPTLPLSLSKIFIRKQRQNAKEVVQSFVRLDDPSPRTILLKLSPSLQAHSIAPSSSPNHERFSLLVQSCCLHFLFFFFFFGIWPSFPNSKFGFELFILATIRKISFEIFRD